MAIQHRDIIDPQIHEPKGAASAASGTVYKADGSGSGSWTRISPADLANNTSDFTLAGRHLVVNTSEGIGTVFGPSAASIGFTGNSSPTSLTTTFKTLTGAELPWADNVNVNGVTDAPSGELITPAAGLYELSVQFVVEADTVDGLKLLFKSDPSGVVFWETVHQPLASNKETISFSSLVQMNSDVSVSIQAASETGSGDIVFITGDFRMKLVGDGV